MLSPDAIARHLKVAHSHFGASDLFDDAGDRVEGFFLTRTTGDEENRVPENIRYFRSPTRLALRSRITNRKTNEAWIVKFLEGNEGAFIHTLETAPAA